MSRNVIAGIGWRKNKNVSKRAGGGGINRPTMHFSAARGVEVLIAAHGSGVKADALHDCALGMRFGVFQQ